LSGAIPEQEAARERACIFGPDNSQPKNNKPKHHWMRPGRSKATTKRNQWLHNVVPLGCKEERRQTTGINLQKKLKVPQKATKEKKSATERKSLQKNKIGKTAEATRITPGSRVAGGEKLNTSIERLDNGHINRKKAQQHNILEFAWVKNAGAGRRARKRRATALNKKKAEFAAETVKTKEERKSGRADKKKNSHEM